MDRKKAVRDLKEIGRDILIAFLVVAVIMAALWAYCGIWPPMVVVESGSMSRYDDRSVLGVIDTGDMVLVKTVDGTDDIRTYVDGEMSGYSKYGSYGDVIIYKPNGDSNRTPIIHRAVLWLEVNASRVNPYSVGIDYRNYSFDVPSLGLYGTTEDITLADYGYWKENVTVALSPDYGLLRYYEYVGTLPHGGYITMGDHNVPAYDQPLSGAYEPVLPEWIVGKAWGEIPWFGLVKLKLTGGGEGAPGNSWRNLFIAVFLLLLIPLLLDIIGPRLKRRKAEKQGAQAGEEADGKPPAENAETRPDPEDGGKDCADEAGAGSQAREKVVIIEEIVRVPCPHCNVLVENTAVKCPNCGAAIG